MAEVRGLPPVRRRRSPIDPVAGTWAVVGCGAAGVAALAALRAHGIPALGYDAAGPSDGFPPPEVRWEHRVIDIEEVEDVDQLAVTSEDAVSGEINTDYVTGAVIAVPEHDGWPFLDDELMNVHDGLPHLAHGVFTPRHPGIVALDSTGAAPELLATYAALLWRFPRSALRFHRRVCEPLLPGWPQATGSNITSEDELRRDLTALVALRNLAADGA